MARRPDQITPREVAELFDGPAVRPIRSPYRIFKQDRTIAARFLEDMRQARMAMLDEWGKATFADFLLKEGEKPRLRRVSKVHLANCPFHAAEERVRAVLSAEPLVSRSAELEER